MGDRREAPGPVSRGHRKAGVYFALRAGGPRVSGEGQAVGVQSLARMPHLQGVPERSF